MNTARTIRCQTAQRCRHVPRCPSASQPDSLAAAVIAAHPEQGWYLLCNGIITFDDTGAIIGRAAIQPRRAAARPVRRRGATRSSGRAA